MISTDIKNNVKRLRALGYTYFEIQKKLNLRLPKSTLSYWCKNINLPLGYQQKISKYNKFNLNKARKKAIESNKRKRETYLNSIFERNKHLAALLSDPAAAKIVLTVLHLTEGSKTQRGSLMFGNSDYRIIALFLHLLRYCYNIDETKFRCTLQCRADQDIRQLEKFWSEVTKIPSSQFYKARIDPRTINKPSKKLNYKGVCRIDYFSAEIDIELTKIAEIITLGI